MERLAVLRRRRQEILVQIGELEEMRRGSVVEQFVERVNADGSVKRLGPYPLYSYKEKKKTVSRRLKGAETATVYRRQIDRFRRFQALCAELVAIGEEISDIVVSAPDNKKNPKGRRRTGR